MYTLRRSLKVLEVFIMKNCQQKHVYFSVPYLKEDATIIGILKCLVWKELRTKELDFRIPLIAKYTSLNF